MKMRYSFLFFFVFHIGLLYSQSLCDDFNHFTPERSLVLYKMAEFFDETIRKSFPAESDTLSYLHFAKCFFEQTKVEYLQNILDVNRAKLKEINKMLFKDHNYYFFYHRYIIMGTHRPPGYRDYLDEDSIPTVRSWGTVIQRKSHAVSPHLNVFIGYVKLVPNDNHVKEELVKAGGVTPSIFSLYLLRRNLQELSKPHVKELYAVIFWHYICLLGGVDLDERKPICEPCDLL